MIKIFISYRRDDAAGYAGWLSILLKQRFGDGSVFIDLQSIEVGEDFVANIERAIGLCDVLIALIGPQWLQASKADGMRRLDDPRDFVRLEIAAALERRVCVIPALVHGAVMPAEESLPTPLKGLSRRNAIELSDARFPADVERLAQAIDKVVSGPGAVMPGADAATEAPADRTAAPLPGTANMQAPGTGAAIPGQASAVRSVLIADIRGYTRFTVDHGDEAAAQLAGRFAALSEEIAGRFDGRVIELRGDEVFAVFASPRNALRAAVELQTRCAAARDAEPDLPLHAGIGLDAGELVPVREGYRGGALNRAARLCSLAAPGEVFATEGIVHLAGRTEGLAFVDRGIITVKGLAGPVRVLQVATEGTLPDELPPLARAADREHPELPDDPTPFIGRERELAAAIELLDDPSVRMLTLTGPGGTGKTRLALRIVRTLEGAFRDGVACVPLAAMADPALVLSSIAEALGLKEERGRPLLETVTNALRNRHLLLLLDNMEHLLAASPALAQLLDACHRLHLLVTSRTPLHLTREHEFPVPPLDVPEPASLDSPDVIERYESVALFVERARAVKPDFRLTADNARAVAEICARLDGLPLALELAAARIRLFSPSALLPRLSNRLAVLTGGARDQLDRHQTLRGAIDWSYSLLTADEQQLFASLSVFAGGCTFEAVEAVWTEVDRLDPLDGLASLVEKSLVRQTGDEPRFSMLETIREYAAEKLAALPDDREVHRRHAAYYLDLAAASEQQLVGSGQTDALRTLDREHDNFRAALAWALTEEPATALRIAGALRRFWEMRGYLSEGRRWLADVLARDPGDIPEARAYALLGAGALARLQGDLTTARDVTVESIELFRAAGNDTGLAAALGTMGLIAEQRGDLAHARALHEESLALRRSSGDTWGVAAALNNLGIAVHHGGALEEARALFEESLNLCRRIGDQRGILLAVNNLGTVYEDEGKLADAERYYDEGLRIARSLGDQRAGALSLINLGLVALKRDDPEIAALRLVEGVRLTSILGDRFASAIGLDALAQASVLAGRMLDGVRLLAAGDVLLRESGAQLSEADRHRREAVITRAHAALDEPSFDTAWQQGAALTLADALALASALSPPQSQNAGTALSDSLPR